MGLPYLQERVGSPWNLRAPPDFSDISRKGIRALMLEAVAIGNTKTSPFLHGTLSLPRALKIMEERRYLYTSWLVRWPLSEQDAIINLCTKDEQ